jgi:hypothetical protein
MPDDNKYEKLSFSRFSHGGTRGPRVRPKQRDGCGAGKRGVQAGDPRGWSSLAYAMPLEFEMGYDPTDLNGEIKPIFSTAFHIPGPKHESTFTVD